MSKQHRGVVFLFVIALLLVGAQAKPIRGRKGAFGMGLLGGALAGAVVGNVVAKHAGVPKTAAPAAAPVAQVVETGAIDANGCYRQTVKEPVPGNAKLYTETVHLICPNRPAVGQAHPVVVPVQVVPAAAPIPAVTAAQGFNATTHNATQVVVAPAAPAPVPAAAPVPVPAAAPAPAQPGTVAYVPVAPPQQPAGPAQVILLSKTVKKQKSAAASINISHALLILLVFFCIIRHL